MGPLHGRWVKHEPAHIGARARERARERTVAALSERLRGLEEDVDGARSRQEVVAERRRRLEAEAGSLPSDAEIRAAAQALRSSQERVADRRGALERQRRRLEEFTPQVVAAEQD